MKIIYMIKNLLNWIRTLLLIVKIFNIEDLFYNFFNEIILNNIGENENGNGNENENGKEKENENGKEKEKKDDYNKEIHRNSFMLKFIGAVAFICWLKLSKDEMGYVFLAIALSELLEKIVEKTK